VVHVTQEADEPCVVGLVEGGGLGFGEAHGIRSVGWGYSVRASPTT
jgi:hypothetical protein